jgi:hypothetical protein
MNHALKRVDAMSGGQQNTHPCVIRENEGTDESQVDTPFYLQPREPTKLRSI